MKKRLYISPKVMVVTDDFGCNLLTTSPGGTPEHDGKLDAVISSDVSANSLFSVESVIDTDGTGVRTDDAKNNSVGWSDDWDF